MDKPKYPCFNETHVHLKKDQARKCKIEQRIIQLRRVQSPSTEESTAVWGKSTLEHPCKAKAPSEEMIIEVEE